MTARIKITKLLPILNRLSNTGIVPPSTLQDYIKAASQRSSLTTEDVIADLCGFDIPEDKYEPFAAVITMLKNYKEEKQ